MHGPINVKSLNNITKWQMGFISAFKGLSCGISVVFLEYIIYLALENPPFKYGNMA
jgi:hypothetical protein